MKTYKLQSNILSILLTALIIFTPFAYVSAQEGFAAENEEVVAVETVAEEVQTQAVEESLENVVEESVEAVEEEEPVPTLYQEERDTAAEVEEEVQVVAEEAVVPAKMKTASEKKTNRGVLIIQHFDGAVKTLQNVSGRLANKIIEMNEAGIDTGNAKSLVNQGNNSLRLAFGELKKIKEQIGRVRIVGQYEEGFVEGFRGTLRQIRVNIDTTKKSYREALEILKSA